MEINQPKRVLINGASIAGLTAASRLAKFKYQVFLLGDIYKNTELDGFTFDDGELFTLPATFRDFFQKTGKHFGQVLEIKPCEPAFVFRFPDIEINFANLSHSARLTELSEKIGAAAAKEYDQLIKSGEFFWDQLRENYVEWEFSWLKINLPIYLRLRAPFIRDPYLQRIFAHYATYFGYPAGIYKWSSMVAFVEESFGIWQIAGGLGALHDALEKRALELGVKFEATEQFEYRIEANETFNRPARRLIGIADYPNELPVRTVIFHEDGRTTDIYATKNQQGNYSLIVSGALEINDFDGYIKVDSIRPATFGTADNRLITKIRSANKRTFRVRHLDSLAHAAIAGELLANAVRGIKNRPSHEH